MVNAKLPSKIDHAEDINSACNDFQSEIKTIVDTHIPKKRRKNVEKQAPFMNKQLRQAIYKKSMLYNKYMNVKSKRNWECYRLQRNYVNKLKRKSVRHYFIERCVGGPKQKDFWSTIKPFLQTKVVILKIILYYMRIMKLLMNNQK